MQPLVSIIIPIYNVGNYLSDCINSVRNQTYKNTEIILIDDGSTDNSPSVCDSFAAEDSRIKVFHIKNGGVANARNLGLKDAAGDYFCFIDGDDTVAPNYIEFLYELIVKYDADISCCSYLYKWQDGREKCTMRTDKPKDYIESAMGKEVLSSILYGDSSFLPSCCVKLFKSELKKAVCFPRYRVGEDFLACLDYYAEAKKVVFGNEPLYFYLQNDASVMHTTNISKYYDIVLTADKIYEKAVAVNPELKTAASHYVIETNMIMLMKLQYEKNEKEKTDHVKQNIKRYRNAVIFDKNARPKIRLSCILSLGGFKFLCAVRNAVTK